MWAVQVRFLRFSSARHTESRQKRAKRRYTSSDLGSPVPKMPNRKLIRHSCRQRAAHISTPQNGEKSGYFHVSNFRAITKPEVGGSKKNAAIRGAIYFLLYQKPQTRSGSEFPAAHSDLPKMAESRKKQKSQSSHVINSASFDRKWVKLGG